MDITTLDGPGLQQELMKMYKKLEFYGSPLPALNEAIQKMEDDLKIGPRYNNRTIDNPAVMKNYEVKTT